MALTASGEVVEVNQADQFQPNRSQYECGFFAVYIARSMAQVGQAPTLSVSQIIAGAESAYAQYDGNNSLSNTNGMTLLQLYELLAQIGLHYQETAMDAATLHAWLDLGYPVIIAGAETGFYDIGLGDRVPYPWHPSGNHVILITGNAGSNFLVRDSANVGSLSDPNSLRPGPRTYDASRFQLISATVVVPPGMARPTNGDPTQQHVPVVSVWESPAQEQAALNAWNATAHLFPSPVPYNTGIALSWQADYRKGTFHGPPLCLEFADVNWQGVAVRAQVCAGASCTWLDGACRWYKFT